LGGERKKREETVSQGLVERNWKGGNCSSQGLLPEKKKEEGARAQRGGHCVLVKVIGCGNRREEVQNSGRDVWEEGNKGRKSITAGGTKNRHTKRRPQVCREKNKDGNPKAGSKKYWFRRRSKNSRPKDSRGKRDECWKVGH